MASSIFERSLLGADGLVDAVVVLHERGHLGVEALAGRGEVNPVAVALKELVAQLALKAPHRLAQGGARHKEIVGRLAGSSRAERLAQSI